MHALINQLMDWYMSTLETGGYPVVALLMAIESSIFPLPSELVIPFAAHLAYTKGTFSMVGLVLAGAIGSWIGATVMYWASRWAGRPLVLRYGKYILIPEEKVHGAERWAAKFGSMGIFVSRLLPVVRHLIGIPAGIVKLDYLKFSIYTLLGSAIWCTVLCWIGVKAGEDKKLMAGEFQRVTLWLGSAVVILGSIYYYFVHRHMKGSAHESSRL